MRQSLVVKFGQLLQGRLCNVRPGYVVEENWFLQDIQSREHISELQVYLVVSLALLLCCNRFVRI